MKPQSRKDAYLMKHFANPKEENPDMTDREARQLRKMWKRKRNKALRREGKNYE